MRSTATPNPRPPQAWLHANILFNRNKIGYAAVMRNRLRQIVHLCGLHALNTLIPATCALCPTQVGGAGQLCAACFAKLTFITEPACQHCGLPFETPSHAVRAGSCPACAVNPPLWRAARAAFLYDDHGRRLVLGLKHGGREETATMLAHHMARAGGALLAQADMLVPVPLHRSRRIARRYNQAALLAQALGRVCAISVVADALRRPRATPFLGTLSAVRRAEMLRGAFAINLRHAARLKGARIILVDDVLTSGATATVCTDVLLGAGAAHVDVLVACRVPPPSFNVAPDTI